MKILLDMKLINRIICIIILIFSLQSWTKADDIRDFEIEGISVWDSLLDYINEEEIKKLGTKKQGAFFFNKEFISIYLNLPVIKDYDALTITYKTNDDKYIIHSIDGVKYYNNDIKNCIETKNYIIEKLSEIFKDSKKVDEGKGVHDIDKSGESFTYSTYFWIKSGGHIEIACYDMSEKLTKKMSWEDQLKVGVTDKLFSDFLLNVYYK